MDITIQKTPYYLGRRRVAAWAILLGVMFNTLFAGPAETWGEGSEVVARVNGEAVSRSELKRVLSAPATRIQIEQEAGVREPGDKELESLALRKLIQQRLVLQEARRRNLTVTEKEFDETLAALRRSFGDLDGFGAWMKERGLDDKSLFEAVRNDMLANRVKAQLLEGVRPAEVDVQGYYEAHKEDLIIGDEVRLRIIAVKDKRTAEEILDALRKGENFSRLARKQSQGMRAAQGGDTGWVDARTLKPPLKGAVGALKAGDVAGPLQKGPDEFLIAGLDGRRPLRAKNLEEARPEIERRLLPSKQQEVFQAWLTEQEKNSNIEYFLNGI